jgi:hypothetical protein
VREDRFETIRQSDGPTSFHIPLIPAWVIFETAATDDPTASSPLSSHCVFPPQACAQHTNLCSVQLCVRMTSLCRLGSMRRGLLSTRACNSDIPSSVSGSEGVAGLGARSCRPSLSLGVQTRRAISTHVCVKSMAKPALGSPTAALFIDGAYTDADGSALLEVRGKI